MKAQNTDSNLVSVNLTTYNRAKLLPQCLDSIISQSYDNLEIIIIDDGSWDNTQKIVQKYIEKDHRIKYYKNEKNQGNAYSRNRALKHSNGYYVAFMDDDDYWLDHDKIKKQTNILQKSNQNIALVCSSVKIAKADNIYVDKIIKKPLDIRSMILKGNGFIYSPTVLTRKEVMEKVGGFDERLKRGIDSDFFRSLIVMHRHDIKVLEDVTTLIREYGSGRITPQDSLAGLVSSIDCIELYFEKYKTFIDKKYDVKKSRYKQLMNWSKAVIKRKFIASYIWRYIKYTILYNYYIYKSKNV